MIKFIMSKGDDITLSEDKALKIIESQVQLIKITDQDGNWTGKTINKAHIVSTIVDKEATSETNRKQFTPIEAPKKDYKKIGEQLKKFKPEFLKK